MDQHEAPKCSREPDIDQQSTNDAKFISTDQSLQSSPTISTVDPPKSFSINSNSSCVPSDRSRISNLFALLGPSLQSVLSVSDTMAPKSPKHIQPQTLFLLALSKLNESSISFAIINHITSTQPSVTSKIINTEKQCMYLSPPDSLTSAPPSYSFVLRQNMSARRRPRLMGTFIPSPSFIQHTPPPTYATAFDIYVDNSIPPPPPRTYSLGFASMPILCPECGFTGMTITRTKVTLCTHMCAFILCLFCCWICVPLPYVLRSCKEVYHYCANCRSLLGMYCPTNAENNNYR